MSNETYVRWGVYQTGRLLGFVTDAHGRIFAMVQEFVGNTIVRIDYGDLTVIHNPTKPVGI